MTDTTIDAILGFWFLPAEGESQDAVSRRWFRSDAGFDEAIRDRFAEHVTAARQGLRADWAAEPRGWLALLLVLDQFPRNIYRGTALAFAGDSLAQRVALSGIDKGWDLALPPVQRVFAYLPLEHAEDGGLQARSVEAFTALLADAPPAERSQFEGFLDYARRHADVIHRFGRFPHRNRALGRADTAAEEAYLRDGGGF
ncbi:DUF924 family protein [Tahibacter amnicola]|uniref:DUF924 domain-containing protein n=1 Tax=Tahibacter amnicola TaxID=2976241 RepID=A0ABY6BML6_9GAMM|nr:DUF924 family protein [Tahibacter amnicola]UXI69057.1 DUF924 domain-containing protein [Tahibacter amnicola]